MKALYSWERDSLKEPHDAEAMEPHDTEAMERSVLKRENNFVRTADGLDMRTKGEGSVKSSTEERRG